MGTGVCVRRPTVAQTHIRTYICILCMSNMHTIVHMPHSLNFNVLYECSGLEGIESPMCIVMHRVERL